MIDSDLSALFGTPIVLTKGEQHVIEMVHALKIVLVQKLDIDWLDQLLLDHIVDNIRNRFGSAYEMRQLKEKYHHKMPSIDRCVDKIMSEYILHCYLHVLKPEWRERDKEVFFDLD